MFERFIDQARQVIVHAQQEARELRHNYIGTEHILLGLCLAHDPVATPVLEALEVTVERVRGRVVRIVGSGEEATSGQVPFTARAKKAMEGALLDALRLGHNLIGPEHLLLALLRVEEGVAARVLHELSVDRDVIRGRVISSAGRPVAASSDSGVRRLAHGRRRDRPVLDWERAQMLWRPEGLELRIPVHLGEGALASFAADEVWRQEPLASIRRKIWRGWLTLASPTLLGDIDPSVLRRALDAAAKRVGDVRGREQGRVEDFLRRLREEPPTQD